MNNPLIQLKLNGKPFATYCNFTEEEMPDMIDWLNKHEKNHGRTDIFSYEVLSEEKNDLRKKYADPHNIELIENILGLLVCDCIEHIPEETPDWIVEEAIRQYNELDI